MTQFELLPCAAGWRSLGSLRPSRVSVEIRDEPDPTRASCGLGMKPARLSDRVRRHIPSWAVQFGVGMALFLVAIPLFGALLGAPVRCPTAFSAVLGGSFPVLAHPAQPDADARAQLQAATET